ncbi:KAR4 [Candida theae]|uniref:KAR4 n=1 Tax=Candida theae TaxID=1198502 RepID=A0AAD5FWC3_9ASCO|nr:KAR4 [Candida theae]KAI5948763.1 KAR4 [Candida theae]
MYTYNKFGSRASTATSGTQSSKQTSSSLSTVTTTHTAHTKSAKLTSSDKIKKDTSKAVLQPIDYSNHYIHTGEYATKFIRNVVNPLDGYPKLNKLHELKKQQVAKHATKAFGVRCPTDKIVPTLNTWIQKHNLKFDVIMIGALVDNQFILPVLNSLPIHKLCSKPGFLFIWSTTQKIQQLTKLLNNDNFNKKFRRSEELIFLPINDKSPYYPHVANTADEKSLFEKQQWHCWMCITGTVRRSTDNDLIHCNIDTDLQIESPSCSKNDRNACPVQIYQVAENFSNSNRRLHIIPSKLGPETHVKLRPGWVILGPDVLLNNFDPETYNDELHAKSVIKYKQANTSTNTNLSASFLVPQTSEIEDLRPKSPVVSAK